MHLLRYGHVYKLAKKVAEGLNSVEGVEAEVYQVQETLPNEVLEKMHAPPKPDVPFITVADLIHADGYVFGFPTRFGNMPAQMKAFIDATGGLWQQGALVGKPFSMFTSTASLGGGQETTIYASLPPFIHHGMVYVPPGYTFGSPMFDIDAVRGGSAYGAGTFAGADGSRQPTEIELEQARHLVLLACSGMHSYLASARVKSCEERKKKSTPVHACLQTCFEQGAEVALAHYHLYD
eukprot:jgi/Botrbrau1/3183/Bobra.37_2s0013.1